MPEHDHTTTTLHASSFTSWLVLIPPLMALMVYVLAAYRQSRSGRPWPRSRGAAFCFGMALVGVAISPPMSVLAHQDLRAHMVQHLTIGMFAPVALILSMPVTLFLRSVPVQIGRTTSSVLRSRPIHLLSHPVTALVLNIGGMYVLYLTPLFALSMENPALHALVNVHFLAAGYLFAWSIAGQDPAPGRPGLPFRVGTLILSLGLHAFLGKLMYAHLLPGGVPFDAEEIRKAAVLMYYGGDVAEVLLAIVLFTSWFQQRKSQRRRLTQKATSGLANATA